MRCARCGHAAADHATGHCVNRRAYFDADKGAVVTDVCSCKVFEKAQTPAEAARAAELADDVPVPEPKVVPPTQAKEPAPEPKSQVEPPTLKQEARHGVRSSKK